MGYFRECQTAKHSFIKLCNNSKLSWCVRRLVYRHLSGLLRPYKTASPSFQKNCVALRLSLIMKCQTFYFYLTWCEFSNWIINDNCPLWSYSHWTAAHIKAHNRKCKDNCSLWMSPATADYVCSILSFMTKVYTTTMQSMKCI